MTLLRICTTRHDGAARRGPLRDPGFAQDGYRTPPDAITKILDSPAPPAVSVSSDRRWLLITTADVPETTIAELAEPTLFLAGRRFQTQPRHRIDFEGVRTASLKPVDGGAGDHDSRAGRRPSHAAAVESRREAARLLRHDARIA